MKVLLVAAALALVSSQGFASLLTVQPGPKKIEGVAIGQSATAQVESRNSSLGLLGAGLRIKKVAIMNVKVYVAQVFGSEPTAFVRTESRALETAAAMKTTAIQLSFLRTVEAEKVQTSFGEALIANKIDLKKPAIKAFLDAVTAGGDAASGKAITLVFEHLSDGTEAVTYENTSGKAVVIRGGVGFVHDVLSIWLGNSSDSGVEALKKSIIGG